MSQTYLINQATFQQYEDISINVKPERLNVFIKKAQELDLKLFLGYAFYYDLIKNCNTDGSLKNDAPEVYTRLLTGCEYTDRNGHKIIYDGLAPAMVYFTLARFVEADAVRYSTTGPVLKSHDNAQAIPLTDIVKLVQQYRSIANAHVNEIEKFLWDNQSDYPLWQFDERNKTARQPGPRIRAVDKTDQNYPSEDFNASLYTLINGYG